LFTKKAICTVFGLTVQIAFVLWLENVFMLIDDLAHQHFAQYIRVKAVNGELGIHDLMG
jgi:hypothetical protein